MLGVFCVVRLFGALLTGVDRFIDLAQRTLPAWKVYCLFVELFYLVKFLGELAHSVLRVERHVRSVPAVPLVR